MPRRAKPAVWGGAGNSILETNYYKDIISIADGDHLDLYLEKIHTRLQAGGGRVYNED
jgi:hypothetical protein